MPKSRFFYLTFFSFNAIRENKILAKIPNLQYNVSSMSALFVFLSLAKRPVSADKTNKMVCVSSEDSDQSGHLPT